MQIHSRRGVTCFHAKAIDEPVLSVTKCIRNEVAQSSAVLSAPFGPWRRMDSYGCCTFECIFYTHTLFWQTIGVFRRLQKQYFPTGFRDRLGMLLLYACSLIVTLSWLQIRKLVLFLVRDCRQETCCNCEGEEIFRPNHCWKKHAVELRITFVKSFLPHSKLSGLMQSYCHCPCHYREGSNRPTAPTCWGSYPCLFYPHICVGGGGSDDHLPPSIRTAPPTYRWVPLNPSKQYQVKILSLRWILNWACSIDLTQQRFSFGFQNTFWILISAFSDEAGGTGALYAFCVLVAGVFEHTFFSIEWKRKTNCCSVEKNSKWLSVSSDYSPRVAGEHRIPLCPICVILPEKLKFWIKSHVRCHKISAANQRQLCECPHFKSCHAREVKSSFLTNIELSDWDFLHQSSSAGFQQKPSTTSFLLSDLSNLIDKSLIKRPWFSISVLSVCVSL